jgi:dihydrofolate reductase
MRKLIVQQWISADGFATDSHGTTSFFESPKYNEGWQQDELELFKNIYLIILGANTYKMFVDYWPDAQPEDEAVAPFINSTKKLVFSRSLHHAPWGRWEPAEVTDENAVRYIKHLKEESGKDMILWGSLSLCKALAYKNLPDEYHLTIAPAFVGSGRHFLPDDAEWTDMELVSSKAYPSGVVCIVYRPRAK